MLLVAAIVSGCANEGGSNDNGDPGAKPLAAGQTCQSVRAELNKLDAKGAQSKVEAASQGKKLPPAQQAEVLAQREIVEDTALHCAVRAGRASEARRLLQSRLDRRPFGCGHGSS